MSVRRVHVAFLGGGPAGSGPLFAALKHGTVPLLLESGAKWLESSSSFGMGTIGSYRITSDTQASVLLECLPKNPRDPLGDLVDSEEARSVESFGVGPIPLAVASSFLARAGASLRALVERSPPSAVRTGFFVERVDVEDEGFCITGRDNGQVAVVRSRCLVSALGGRSAREEALLATLPCGTAVGSLGLPAVATTDELFRNGIAKYSEAWPSGRPARIAILGGSHSAYATAVKILGRLGGDSVRIRVLCRRLPKVFYPTLEAAHADGYKRPSAEDVCPITKRVFRLAGLRLHARELVRGIWGLGDAKRESSVTIEHLIEREPSFARTVLADADLVVLALGYRPRTVPFYENGERLPLLAESGAHRPLVDGECRILRANGSPLARAFGLGLASGFVPHGPMGGEPSFDGQTNGLWLYQNDVGTRVLNQVLALR